MDGTVSSLKVAKGDQVTSGQEVAVIRDSSKMLLNLLFPAADAANFSVGQSADVVLDGTFETLKGTVTAVTVTDELSTGNLLVRTVTIRVNNAGGLTTAQAATASINGVSSIASATFAYQAERTLTALASGTVSAINVQEGDAVSKGDILIELTGDDLPESIQSASESLRSAEISMQNQQDNMSNYTITSPISGTIIEKDAKQGDALTSGSTLCVIYDLSYLVMVINVDELQIGALSVGQKVQLTADAVTDKTYVGTVTRVSMKGSSSGGTTTYPITIRIDDTDGLRPGMNANAEIVVAEANNALVVPNAAVIRGGYVLVSKKSPSAANAVEDMDAPEGYVYVKVETGVSDDSYTEIKSGLQADEFEQVCKYYQMGDTLVKAADHITMKIEKGEFVAIVGQSGSGKSTCMNIIGCLDVPTHGIYRLNGRDVGKMNRDELADVRNEMLGFIFQQYNLLPRLNLLENVEVPLVYANISRAERHKLARDVLEKVGLVDKLKNLPNQLSGGQQQRVSIARALVRNPAVILADEPTGALDSHTGREVIGMLQQLHREGHTVVLITHDNSIAVQAERIIRLEDGQVVYDGDAHAPEAIVQPTLSGEAAQEEAK